MTRHVLVLMLLVAALALPIAASSCGSDPAGRALPGRGVPAFVDATALSKHYIGVTFSKPMGEEAERPEAYLITAPDSSRLRVHAARLSPDRTQVLLTTDAQQDVEEYTLTLDGIALLDTTTATIVPSNVPEPELDTAISLGTNTVLLTMSERMDRPSTEAVEFYRIFAANAETPREDVADVGITNAVLEDSTITVLLTTSDQTNIEYTVKMTNATRGPGPFLINPELNTRTFFGIRPDDFVPPRLVKAEATGSKSVLLTFSEPLRDESDALSEPRTDESNDAGNFTISPSLVVTDAKLTGHKTQILLTTLTQVPDRLYTVTVTNVKDIAGNVIRAGTVCIDNGDDCTSSNNDCNANVDCVDSDTADFRGSSRDLFVHSALSLANTQVLVTFSEPMNPATTECANRDTCRAIYSIADPDGDTDVDIIVESAIADTGEGDRTVVLNTTSQENILYTLTVRNVKARRDDFLIDPTRNTATFSGIPTEDAQGPSVLSAVATNNTTVLISFSEPLGGTGILDSPPDGEPDDPSNFRITLASCTKDHCGSGALEGERCADDSDCPLGLEACIENVCAGGINNGLPCDEDLDCPVDNSVATCLPATLANCPGLIIEDAELTVHDTQVLLTTLAQVINLKYTVTASKVKDKSGNDLVEPDSGDFKGVPRIDTGPPRVIGAISTSNTTVLVTFSKRMGPSAADPANYSIRQENVQPEAGALAIVSARFINEEIGDAVQLTTLQQSEVTYRVTAVNVLDALGNQLAPQELLVNPTIALFKGTPFGCPSLRHCTNGARGLNGAGACATDNDCDDNPPCGQSEEDCQGTCVQPPEPCAELDSDGDGLPDNEEQRGWVVRVRLTDGTFTERDVTSDPFVADTDGDGLDDRVEKFIAIDPRDSDTDDDLVSDTDEWNLHLTSPIDQDTDGDGLQESFELDFFKTSPLLADTDGDGFTDDEETLEMNRDPRVADVPRPRIQVGDTALRLDTRFSYTDQQGLSRTSEESVSTSLVTSQETSFAFSDTSTTTFAVELSGQVEKELGPKGGTTLTGGAKFNFTQENQTQVTQESKQGTQEAYERSLTTSQTVDEIQEVTREVVGASMEVALNISNIGDIAFTMTNLEVTAMLQDPVDRARFIPVATLVPATQLITGEIPAITAGLFAPERGPFIFTSRDVFPTLVEDLMRNPRGLIFKVANFDVLDEFGRNFAFVEQSINERTAGLTIDFGNSRVERFRVATYNSFEDVVRACDGSNTFEGQECDIDSDCGTDGRCARALCEGGALAGRACRIDADCGSGGLCKEDLLGSVLSGSFRDDGKARGIRLKSALQGILGLVENASPDAITVGPNGCGETWASGDDIQVFAPVCFAVIRQDSLIILPGPNGILNSVALGDDVETLVDVGDCSDHPDLKCTVNADCGHFRCDAGSCDDNQVACSTATDCNTGTCENITRQPVIVDGGDGCAQSSPARDDQPAIRLQEHQERVQQIGCAFGGPDGEIILAGPNGVLDTQIPLGLPGRCLTDSCDLTDMLCSNDPCRACLVDSDCGGFCSNDTDKACTENAHCPALAVDDQIKTITGYGTTVIGVCSGDSEKPGIECSLDADCTTNIGTCRQLQVLTRVAGIEDEFAFRCNGDSEPERIGRICDHDDPCLSVEDQCGENGECEEVRDRFWLTVTSGGDVAGVDFDEIRLRPGDAISLAYVQDTDGDGLLRREEFLYGSSDIPPRGVNSDGCPFLGSAASSGCLGLTYDSVGDFSEVRRGWEIRVVGPPSYFAFSDPTLPDSDLDLLFDDEEQTYGTDPVKRDTDDDGVNDFDELNGYLVFDRDRLPVGQVPAYVREVILDGGLDNGGVGLVQTRWDGDDVWAGVCTTNGKPCEGNNDCPNLGACRALAHGDLVGGRCTGSSDNVIRAGANGIADSVVRIRSDDIQIVDFGKSAGPDVCTPDFCDGGICHFWLQSCSPSGCPLTYCASTGQLCATDADCTAGGIVIEPGPNGILESVPGDALGRGLVDNITADDILGRTVLCFDSSDAECEGTCNLGAGTCARNPTISCSGNPDCSGTCESMPGGVIMLPGQNGRINSTLDQGGDDFIAQFHETHFATDPLNRDTDGDTLFDGVEANLGFLGANPNDPTDAADFRDDDRDGLVNRVERNGWFPNFNVVPAVPPATVVNLECKKADGTIIATTNETDPLCLVRSDPYEPDTDLDGVSDLLEQILQTNPRHPDTDGDTLSDFDEINPQSRFSFGPSEDTSKFRKFENECFEATRCVQFDTDASQLFGTDPKDTDTDDDGRTDEAELFEPWTINVFGEDSYRVFSDPLEPDADADDLKDSFEEGIETDPTKADTDGDGLSDRREIVCWDGTVESLPPCTGPGQAAIIGSNPLIPDQSITISLASITVLGDCDSGGGGGEFEGDILVQKSGLDAQCLSHLQNAVGEASDPRIEEGGVQNSPHAGTCMAPVSAVASSHRFAVREGDSIIVFSTNVEEDDGTDDEQLGSFREIFSFPIRGQLKIVDLKDPGDDQCALVVIIEVIWNR